MTEIHPAKKAALDLFKAFSLGRSINDLYPVDCEFIAKNLGIEVIGESMGDDFQACLYLSGKVKAIIYNSAVSVVGRLNFTIGHELGHYCLHRNLGDRKCTLDDLDNIGSTPPHGQDIEREANLFAANLLMPPSDFRSHLIGSTADIELITALSARYGTSILATLYRLKELSAKPIAIMMVDKSDTIMSVWKNRGFEELYIPKSYQLDEPLLLNRTHTVANPEYFGIRQENCPFVLYESSMDYRFNGLKIVLLTGEPM